MRRISSRTSTKTKAHKRSRNRRRFLVTLIFFLCGAIAITSTAWLSNRNASAAPQDMGISPEALAQIEALIREKESRSETERKMDSQLIYEAKMERGEAIADGIRRLDTDVQYSYDGRTIVDITANVSDQLLAELANNGAEILETVAERNSVRAAVPVENLEAIAALSDVRFIQPRQDAMTSGSSRTPEASGYDVAPGTSARPEFGNRANKVRALLNAALQGSVGNVAGNVPTTGQGSQTSEGDATHRAFAARGTFHANGSGIKIGVLSDGVTSLAASQALGDLGPVTVLPGQAGSGDEGTAMLEIIHDIAPGAQLYFATAFTSITSFAQNIRDLRAAGCDIIVDDVFYFVETPFQDGQLNPTNTNGGVVIQAVNDVTAGGAMYFSSAGNSGNLSDGSSGVWEGNFLDGGPTGAPIPATSAGRLHNFGGSNFNTLLAANTAAPISLYWSDPLGASTNDYDLFRLTPTGNAVAASSTNIQSGTQDPYETMTQSTVNPRIVIVKKTAAAARFLHLNTNRGRLQIATAGQTHGHSAAANAFSTAASPARLPFGLPPNPTGPFPNQFSPTDQIELFSSDGPRRIFFQANGTLYNPLGGFLATGGIVRQKPDITAADGTAVTGVGAFPTPFYGTSAAAPHAAAIAALLKSADPLSITNAEIRTALTSSAIDIEGVGPDRDSGAGIVMAYNAFQALGVEGTANLEFGSIDANEDPGDGNGSIDAGEGARVDIQLQNLGVADATGVTATLSTSTPGITVNVPNSSSFPDLAASGGNSFSLSPFRFTVASNAPCPLLVNFTLTVNYNGGGSPEVLTFTVQTGKAQDVSETLDATAPALPPGFTSAITGVQTGRLQRFLPPSSCGVDKANPGVNTAVGARRFDAYTFTACSDTCVTVTNNTGAGNVNLFSVVYQGEFNPANPAANYRADSGSSLSGTPFSFNATAGQTYTIVVHEVNPGGGIGNNYTLNVLGCIVNCEPPNQTPVAKAKNVTVSAGPDCTANASADDGSFDPDGDPLVITQSPAGPYRLGTTTVLLTVTDPSGATSQATATVTVVDSAGPEVTGASASPDSLWPPNHQMVPITISYSASDDCNGGANCSLSVSSNEPVHGQGDDDTGPDWIVVDDHHVMLRAERAGKGSGRVYTITIDCVDGGGNHTIRTVTVRVPKSQGG